VIANIAYLLGPREDLRAFIRLLVAANPSHPIAANIRGPVSGGAEPCCIRVGYLTRDPVLESLSHVLHLGQLLDAFTTVRISHYSLAAGSDMVKYIWVRGGRAAETIGLPAPERGSPDASEYAELGAMLTGADKPGPY